MKNKKYNIKKMHTRAWKLMSEIVRRQSFNGKVYKCFTCGKSFLNYKELTAGHYKHNCLDFNYLNVHSQCQQCNYFKHGNLGEYLKALQKKYGQDIDDKIEIARSVERKQKKGILYYMGLIQDLKEQLKIIKENEVI